MLQISKMRIINIFLGILLFPLMALCQEYYDADSTYTSALSEINSDLERAQDNDDLAMVAKAYYDRAMLNFNTPLRNQDIIGDLIESAKIYKYLQDELGYYTTRLGLAEFYINEEIYLDEALRLAAESFRYYKKHQLEILQARATTLLGRVYQKKLDYEKAIAYVDLGLQASIKLKDRETELLNRLLIVELFGNLGNVEKVVQHGTYAIQLEKSYEVDLISNGINYLIGKNLAMDGQKERALEYLLAATEGLNEKSDLAYDVYRELAKEFNEAGEMSEAFKYLLKAEDVQDDLHDKEKYALANQTAVKYQIREKEREIRELEQDNELKQSKLTQRTRLFMIFLAILLLGSAAGFNYYRLQKHKLETESLIARQREEISGQKIIDLENSLKIKDLEAMVNGQEVERSRIAKDLHDSLGGMLSTLKLQYDSLQIDHKGLTEDKSYHKIMGLIDEACKDVRDIARNLKPTALERLGLSAALKDLINRYASKGILDISLHVNDVDGVLNEESKLHVYRIIQELLNNALKHAQASEIDVQINRTADELLLMVEDNGKGFKHDEVEKGLGLGNLESRVNVLKGEIIIDSTLDKGTSVIVHIPLKTNEPVLA